MHCDISRLTTVKFLNLQDGCGKIRARKCFGELHVRFAISFGLNESFEWCSKLLFSKVSEQFCT